jgi:pyruvate dehydrogenase E1 component
VTYDPTYGYELAVIIQDGLKRMYELKENKFYYITTMNENWVQPEMPAGVEEGIVKGMYLLSEADSKAKNVVQLMGSGAILREVREAAELLKADWKVDSDVWSITSTNELTRDGNAAKRWNMLHPTDDNPKTPYITEQLSGRRGPVIASTDYMKLYSEQLRGFIPQNFHVLGTDGFGRSDTRTKLRHFFEVNRYFIVITALNALVQEGQFKAADVVKAMKKYGIDPNKVDPMTC